VKKEEASEINVPAPPTIFSVFPKGVSIASKATLPTVNKLILIDLGGKDNSLRAQLCKVFQEFAF